MVKDVACATVDMEPLDVAGGEVDLVTVVGISNFKTGFEEYVLGVEVIG